MPRPNTTKLLEAFVADSPATLERRYLRQRSQLIAHQALADRLAARTDLSKFVPLFAKTQPYLMGWFHKELCDLLSAFTEAVEKGLSPRLMIFAPPRTGKSEPTSRCFPPFLLGNHPEWEIIAATYNQDFANDWGRDVRAIMSDPIYRDMFPKLTIRRDSNAVDKFQTDSAGAYTTVGKGGSLTGRGCHILLIDDPLKDRAEADSEIERQNLIKWYQSTARTRLAPGGGIILVCTRWHELDLAGHLLDLARDNPDADQWHTYSFPAIATEDEPHRRTGDALHPERWPLKELLKTKASIDAREWSALYQQSPVPPEGIHFKREWFDWKKPDSTRELNWYLTTDFAIGEKQTADYTVIWPFAVDSDGDVWFASPVRGRFQAMEIVEHLCDLMDRHKPLSVAIENVHISKTIGPYLRKRMQERGLYAHLEEMTPSKDKLARSASLRGRLQQGRIHFDPAKRADIEPEFLAFPAGRNDDQVDAASTGMMMLDTLRTASGPPKPPPPAPTPWSMEWMKQRMSNRSSDDRSHVPLMLNGKPREPKKKKSSWS
jgi:predicted phage terminase large subunit-like protein